MIIRRPLELRKDGSESTSHLHLYPGIHSELQKHPLFSGEQNVGLLTAEFPFHHPLDRDGNPALVKRMKQMGLRHEQTRGRYGKHENSYVVYGATREQMHHLGHVFGQQAVLHSERGRHELMHTNGADSGRFHIPYKDAHYYGSQEPFDQNNYTYLPGHGWFTINFDFETSQAPKSRFWSRRLKTLPVIEQPVAKDEMNPSGRPRTIGHGALWTHAEFAAEIAKSPHFPQNLRGLVAGDAPPPLNKALPSRSFLGSLQSFVANAGPILNKTELRVSEQKKTYSPPEVCRELAKTIKAVASDFEALRKREVNARGRKLRKNAMDLCPMCGNADMPGICTCVPLTKNAQMGYPSAPGMASPATPATGVQPETPGKQPATPKVPVPGSHGEPAGMAKAGLSRWGAASSKITEPDSPLHEEAATQKRLSSVGLETEQTMRRGNPPQHPKYEEDNHMYGWRAKIAEQATLDTRNHPNEPGIHQFAAAAHMDAYRIAETPQKEQYHQQQAAVHTAAAGGVQKDEKSPGSVKLPPKKGGKTVEGSPGSGGPVKNGKQLSKAAQRPYAEQVPWEGPPWGGADGAAQARPYTAPTDPGILGHPRIRSLLRPEGLTPLTRMRTPNPGLPAESLDEVEARREPRMLMGIKRSYVPPGSAPDSMDEALQRRASGTPRTGPKPFKEGDLGAARENVSPGGDADRESEELRSDKASAGMGFFNKLRMMLGFGSSANRNKISGDANWSKPSSTHSQERSLKAMGTRMARSEGLQTEQLGGTGAPNLNAVDELKALGNCAYCRAPEHLHDCTS